MITDRIEKNILLNAPLTRVWRAISDSKEFGTWFGVTFDGPFMEGESLKGKIVPTEVDAEVAAAQKPYEGSAFEILVEEIRPQTLFSFRWHPFAVDPKQDYSSEPMTLVTFRLDEVSTGVSLTITETGFENIPAERRAEALRMNDGGWAMQVKLIAKYVATR